MTKRFLEALHFQQSFTSTFFFFSFVASLVIGLSKISDIGASAFLLDYPLTASLVAYNFFTFNFVLQSIKILSFSKYYPVFLYFQSLLYLGISFEYQNYGAAYLAIIPSVVGVIGLSKFWSFSESKGEHRLYTFVTLQSLAFTFFSFGSSLFMEATARGGTSLFLTTFVALCFSMILFPSFVHPREYSSHKAMSLPFQIKQMLKDGDKFVNFDKQTQKDRYFFHDMINHLYGLALKLTYRLSKQRGIESEEVGPMLNEIMAIQSVMTDHFGFKHKNVNQCFDYISFHELEPFIQSQLDSFLGESVKVNTYYHGLFNPNYVSEFKEAQIPFASFYRIFTNLLKNVKEANSKNVEIHFEGDHRELTLNIKNDMNQFSDNSFELSEGLSRVIEKEDLGKNDYSGIGLAAIESQCKESAGSFSFVIENGYWLSTVKLDYGEEVAQESEFNDWLNANALKIGSNRAA